jgi:hypothetical protein
VVPQRLKVATRRGDEVALVGLFAFQFTLVDSDAQAGLRRDEGAHALRIEAGEPWRPTYCRADGEVSDEQASAWSAARLEDSKDEEPTTISRGHAAQRPARHGEDEREVLRGQIALATPNENFRLVSHLGPAPAPFAAAHLKPRPNMRPVHSIDEVGSIEPWIDLRDLLIGTWREEEGYRLCHPNGARQAEAGLSGDARQGDAKPLGKQGDSLHEHCYALLERRRGRIWLFRRRKCHASLRR